MSDRPLSVTLGTWGKWPFRFPFRLNETSLRQHRHVMGTTGQGKSKLLAHFTASLIRQGVGVCLIDPHSDLATDVLTILTESGYFRDKSAVDRLLYVEFKRRDRFIPFNVLNQRISEDKPYPVDEIARNMVEVCTRAWASLADGAAPLFENIMLASVPVLVQNNLPLTMLNKLLSEKDFRDAMLVNCTNTDILDFFHNQFEKWGKDTPLMIGSALRRAFLLTFGDVLKYTLGQKENALNFREFMDTSRSLIVDVGGLDEQTQRILGCLITVGLEVASLSRADLPEHKRTQFHLVMDEFSMFSAQSEEALSRVLSLARKYGLFLTLAHQTWSQLSERLQGALQNSMPIYFRLGYDDAVWAAPRLGRANPYHVKHEVKPIKQRELPFEHHPVYFQMQEEYEAWTRRIEDLYPQQCYIKHTRNVPKVLRRFFKPFQTRKMKTVPIPKPSCSPEDIQNMKDYYARTYMKPKEEIGASTAGKASVVPARPTRARLRVAA